MTEKFTNVCQKVKKPFSKLAASVAACSGAVFGTTMVALADTNEAVSAAQSLMGSITATLNITNAVAILTAGIGAVLGLFLAWWGARKLANMVITVFRKGKIKF